MQRMTQDKVALVTGAAGQGMGRSIALTLAREGAHVVVNYRTGQTEAEEVCSAIRKAGSRALAAQGDVFTAEGCRELVARTLESFGRLDICIINPGAGWHPEPPDKLDAGAALADAQAELAPVYHLLPLVLPGMAQRRWGRIIGLCLNRSHPSPSHAYNVAKAARREALLGAVGAAWKSGVTINLIAPGPVDPVADLGTATGLCGHAPAWASRTNVTPQDIAEGVAFLCSDAGRFISGCEMTYLFR
jgi:NAD(P)-dependent dehydrogenase (short-subunit alcohol dehydrogenase family)